VFETGVPLILGHGVLLATASSQRLLHQSGTVCRSQFDHRHHCKFFAADWRSNFLITIIFIHTKTVQSKTETDREN